MMLPFDVIPNFSCLNCTDTVKKSKKSHALPKIDNVSKHDRKEVSSWKLYYVADTDSQKSHELYITQEVRERER